MSKKTDRREFIQAAGLTAAGLVTATASPVNAAPPAAPAAAPTMGGRFRQLLQKREPFQAIAAYDVFTARMVQDMGFPALFMGVFPEMGPLNIMGLTSPYSAILSAVIFNALIIIALIPLALRGVRYRPLGAAALLRRSLLLYGLGGVLVPFIGIKVIDVLLTAAGLA